MGLSVALLRVGKYCNDVALSKDGELAFVDGLAVRAYGPTASQNVDERIEARRPGHLQSCARNQARVGVRDGGPCAAGAAMTGQVPGNKTDDRASVLRGKQRRPVCFEVLVLGRSPLVRAGKVYPELHAVEQAALRDDLLGRHLGVDDSRPGRHPLRRAVRDEASAPVGVAMLELTVHHVRDGLEASMGMVRSPLGLAG